MLSLLLTVVLCQATSSADIVKWKIDHPPLHTPEEAVQILLARKPAYFDPTPVDPPPNTKPILSTGAASGKDWPEYTPPTTHYMRLDGSSVDSPPYTMIAPSYPIFTTPFGTTYSHIPLTADRPRAVK